MSAILANPAPEGRRELRSQQYRNDRPEVEVPLDEIIYLDALYAIETSKPVSKTYAITNRERSVGARLSGEIARKRGPAGLAAGTVELCFNGVAGQSFGAFNNRGMHLTLEGEAQDYVGKGMYGGEIVVKPSAQADLKASENAIIGNTVMYGATGGSLYAAGNAGERLCVRNSGAKAVVEGCGDHGCEYMTGGVTVVLGQTGRNFGAGMSGGVAYIFDPEQTFEPNLNGDMVSLETVSQDIDEELLKTLIERHVQLTSSEKAQSILFTWEDSVKQFWKVAPHVADKEESAVEQDLSVVERAALEQLRLESGGSVTATD